MVLVNPRAVDLGKHNVLLNGRGRDYHVRDFPGPLSIKSVIRGSAVWSTEEGRFDVGPGSCLVVNDRQPYSLTIESKEVVETFCVFFARGFVEDILRTTTTADTALLDTPEGGARVEFHERIPRAAEFAVILRQLYSDPDEALVQQLGEALVRSHEDTLLAVSRLPAVKASTRGELLRRVHRGRNVLEGSLEEPVSIPEAARQAALSPYHFHRSFRQVFGETPHEYVTRRRLQRAEGLLRNTDVPVTEICFACGFQSVGSFSTLFRRKTGASPREFRRARN